MRNIEKKANEKLTAILDSLKIARKITAVDKKNIITDNKKFLDKNHIERYKSNGLDDLKLEVDKTFSNIAFTGVIKKRTSLSFKRYFNKKYFSSELPRCCFCGQLLEMYSVKDNKETYPIADIEHIFPKGEFPQYGLCVENWAPCCGECNSNIKLDNFFKVDVKTCFYKALEQLGISETFGKEPLKIWKNVSIDFSTLDGGITICGKKQCVQNTEAFQLISFYGIEKRYKLINKRLYNNLLNVIKYQNITSPEGLEVFLEACLSSNMNEIISDFSINNYPKLWQDFLDFVLYDYNNLTALWEELKEYNKLSYFTHNCGS